MREVWSSVCPLDIGDGVKAVGDLGDPVGLEDVEDGIEILPAAVFTAELGRLLAA